MQRLKTKSVKNACTFELDNTLYSCQAPLVIAEIAQAHDGSLGLAHAFIDAVAGTGANAIKFQTHIAEAESTDSEEFRTKFSYQDKTRYDYWKRMEFTPEQWAGLKTHAEERGLIFLSSPFSFEAVDILANLDVVAWKIGSGEVSNLPMLQKIAGYGKPILLSSGLSAFSELRGAVNLIKESNCELLVFQATTEYPCVAEKVGLNLLEEISARFDVPVGLSDHSGTIFPSIAAVTLGAAAVEVHVTLSRQMFGPDVQASVTIAELTTLVQGVKMVGEMLASPVQKDAAARDLRDVKVLFSKSVVLTADLEAGSTLTPEALTVKKPGTGAPPDTLSAFYGKKLKRTLPKDHMLSLNDVG